MKHTIIPAFILALILPATSGAAKPTYGKTSDGAVRYVHGGVGQNGAKKIQKLASDYDLWLVFTDTDERFLADVNVEVVSSGGETVLELESKGPMMLADLPEGQYVIHANLPERNKAKQSVTVRDEDRTKITMRLGDR